MISIQGEITPQGALVNLEIGFKSTTVKQLRQSGQTIPQPVRCTALIDPGADLTCLDPTVLAPLRSAGLTHQKFIVLNAPSLGGLGYVIEYVISLRIVHPDLNPQLDFLAGNHPIAEKDLKVLGYEALIGRDILSKCMLILDGPSNRFTLAY